MLGANAVTLWTEPIWWSICLGVMPHPLILSLLTSCGFKFSLYCSDGFPDSMMSLLRGVYRCNKAHFWPQTCLNLSTGEVHKCHHSKVSKESCQHKTSGYKGLKVLFLPNTVPAMQPGKRSSLALCQSDSLIQLPSWLFAPSAGMGMVSRWFLVTITVLLSTRATSFGSVRASQLKNRTGTRAWCQTTEKP